MAVSAVDALAARADKMERRLKMYRVLFAAAAVSFVISRVLPWYRFEYVSEWFGGGSLKVKPVVDVDVSTMLGLSGTTSTMVSNPQVSNFIGFPIFLIAPLVGLLVSTFGVWVRSAALTALGLLGHLFGWMHLSRVRWWFENSPGRDGWEVSRSQGQKLFFFALVLVIFATLAASIQALATYKASRKVRLAKGEAVEESASEMFVRIVLRSASNEKRTGSSASKQ